MSKTPPTKPAVARQISLPMSKAVEIAWKSIRMRLSRSMLVTSAIILALAFLCSIMVTESLIDGLRNWTAATPLTPEYAALRTRRDTLDAEIKALENQVRQAAQYTKAPAKDAKLFDPKAHFDGQTWDDIRAAAGAALPVSAGELNKVLTQQPEMLKTVESWISGNEQRQAIRAELNRPEDLKAAMTARGVPTEPAEIEANKIQTRWVIGLALLVAFVGILNAMLMSVTERFREIGTMKCLGALDGFIVKLFLLESLFQGAVGTVLGVLLGLLVSFAMALMSYGAAALLNVPWNEIAVAVAVSLVVGMVLSVGGAILPAAQAARMHPIEAMRVEA
ncbi:MAG TPA: ABC transporter permease [Tepidisphaeraceae bacterium]|jgi:predicted outer membrane lipoprotein